MEFIFICAIVLICVFAPLAVIWPYVRKIIPEALVELKARSKS